MATNTPMPSDSMTHFNRVAEQIERTFNQLIAQLMDRKDALLQKVLQLREDYHNKETTRIAALGELRKAQRHMAELSLKVNAILPLHEQAEQVYEQGQKELETSTKLPEIAFTYRSLPTLISLISEFGEIVQWQSPDYSLKKKPFMSAGKLGRREKECYDARGVALDEINEKVYIADYGNSRVHVLSFQGEFLIHFGQEVLIAPCGIAVTEEYIFITDRRHHSLFQFRKDALQLVNRAGTIGTAEGELWYPRGLCVDMNQDVFIADSINNRVDVFAQNLHFKSYIGEGMLQYPEDVKLTTNTVIVLDGSPNCIRIFSRSGDLLSSCVSQGEHNCLVYQPLFFCLDPDQNILISDTEHHALKIFTKSGKLTHILGKRGKGKGRFIRPNGISISISGKIFVVSNNPNNILQCF